jgi:hypothetical protein
MANRQNIQFQEYDFIIEGVGNIGYTKMDQTMTTLGITYREVNDSAQFTGVVARAKSGAAPALSVEIYETKFPRLFNDIAGAQVYPIIDGARLAWGLGSRTLDLFEEAVQVTLHPTGTDADDYSADVMYWKCVPDLSQVQLKGGRDGARSIVIPWTVLPNEDVSVDLTYGMFGDHTAVEADPYGIFLTTERTSRVPHKHVPALTLNSNSTMKIYANGFYKTNGTTTAALNEAGDITATTASFDIDTLNVDNGFNVGDYLLFSGTAEVVYVTAITYATATTATIDVVRGIGGVVAAIHLDNAVLTKLENVYVLPISRRSTWASSAGDDVSVGNSNLLETKGLLTWLADGSDTITAVVGATTSQAMTVTTTT